MPHNFQSLIWGFPRSLSSFPSLQGLRPRPEEKFSRWRGTGGLGDISLKMMAKEKQWVANGKATLGVHVSGVPALAHPECLRWFLN